MALADQLIDKRIVERSIRRGKVERGDYEAALDALPDVSKNILSADEEAGGDKPTGPAASEP